MPLTNLTDKQYAQSQFDRRMAELAELARAEEEMPDICLSASPIEPSRKPTSVPPLAVTQSTQSSQSRGGPKTPEGKAVSCLNAVKTALTGRTVLLPSDDADAYRHHVTQYFKEWRPGSEREEALVQSLADTDWRIDRLPGLDYALFALGYHQFAELFPGEAPAIRKLLIEAHTLVTFEKQFRNLHIQEGRLHRQRERDQAELRQLKKERHDQERLDLECAAKLYLKAKQVANHSSPPTMGSNFQLRRSNNSSTASAPNKFTTATSATSRAVSKATSSALPKPPKFPNFSRLSAKLKVVISKSQPMLSIVIPIHNEEPAILPLYDRLTTVLEHLGRTYEIIFVDDASTDRSFDLLANLIETDNHLKVIRLRRNFGQTAALAAGFDEAKGEVIVSLDGDLQHDPEDIPLLLEKIDEGFDIASGWRKHRVDNAVTRKIPSRIANWMMKRVSGVELHDFGTTFKAYRSEILKDINLYGELHRFIPALASFYGATIVEVPIRNIERPNGASHYGLSRTFRVFFDIITIKFLLQYLTRPMHFFGKWGLGGLVLGTLVMGFMLIEKLIGHDIIVEHGPLLVAGALLWLAGLMMFSTGLIGEVLMRTYFESQGRRIYAVREIRCRRELQVADGAR